MKKLNILVLLVLLAVSVGFIVYGFQIRGTLKGTYIVSAQMTNIVGVPTGNNSWEYTGTVNNCKGVKLFNTSNLGGPNPKDMTVWIRVPTGTSCPNDAVIVSPTEINKKVSNGVLLLGGLLGLITVHVFFLSMGKK